MGEVDVARAVITSLNGAVGAVVVIARTVAEAVDGVGAPDIAPEQAVGERSGAVVVVNAATVACRRVAHQVAVDIGVGVRVEEDTTAKLRVVAMDQTVGQQVLAIAVNTATILCAIAVDQTVRDNIIVVAVNTGATIRAVVVNLTVVQSVIGVAEYAATVCLRTGVVANLRADDLRPLGAQSGTAAVKIAVGFEAVVADDTVADDIGSHAGIQRDVREHAGTELGHGFTGAAGIIDGVVLHDTVAQGTILLQIDTGAVSCESSVLDGEAVPSRRRGRREVGCLEEHSAGVLAVENGGVRLEVTLGEVVVGRFVSREASIHAHARFHQEGVFGRGVAIVGARRDPYHGVVRLGQGLSLLDGRDGVRPAVAVVCAGTLFRDVDDTFVLGQGSVAVIRFVAAHIDRVTQDAGAVVQVGVVVAAHHEVVASVHADGAVLQVPVGVRRGVCIARRGGRLHETGTVGTAAGVLRDEVDIAFSFITALHRSVSAVERV